MKSLSLIVLIVSWCSIDCYQQMDNENLVKGRFIGGTRMPKFLKFRTNDEDIIVDMELSVPFLTIPVKRSINSATGLVEKFKSANINLAAVGLASTIVFAASFILPSILKMFSVDHITYGAVGQTLNNEWAGNSRFGRIMEARKSSTSDCISKALCWIVKRSVEASEKGNPSSIDKIIDGLASNEWIIEILKGTSFSEAIAYGYIKENCSEKYSECEFNQNTIQDLTKTLIKIFNT